MKHYRLVLDPKTPHLVDESGVITPVVEALRDGRVAIEHEENFRFLDGQYRPLYYMLMAPRPIGGHFVEPLTREKAEHLAREAGVEIKHRNTPIPRACERQVGPIVHLPFGQFATLPILEHLHEGQVYDGFWARRVRDTETIVIREAGQWVEHPAEFTK